MTPSPVHFVISAELPWAAVEVFTLFGANETNISQIFPSTQRKGFHQKKCGDWSFIAAPCWGPPRWQIKSRTVDAKSSVSPFDQDFHCSCFLCTDMENIQRWQRFLNSLFEWKWHYNREKTILKEKSQMLLQLSKVKLLIWRHGPVDATKCFHSFQVYILDVHSTSGKPCLCINILTNMVPGLTKLCRMEEKHVFCLTKPLKAHDAFHFVFKALDLGGKKQNIRYWGHFKLKILHQYGMCNCFL